MRVARANVEKPQLSAPTMYSSHFGSSIAFNHPDAHEKRGLLALRRIRRSLNRDRKRAAITAPDVLRWARIEDVPTASRLKIDMFSTASGHADAGARETPSDFF